jgi:hypothetical protein
MIERVSSSRAERAARRGGWPGRVTTLDGQDDAMIVRHATPAERILMLWRVTRDAWVSPANRFPCIAAPRSRAGSREPSVTDAPESNDDFMDLLRGVSTC